MPPEGGPPAGGGEVRLPTRCLVVLVGPSSAGKSTWARQAFREGQVAASDDLRAAVGESRHDLAASADAFDLLHRVIALRTGRRLLTVVDTTGLDGDHRAAWIAAARAAGMPAIAIRFTTPPRVVRARNRVREVPLPAAALSRQLRDLAATTTEVLAAEGFDAVHEVDGTGEGPLPVVTAQPAAPVAAIRQREAPARLRFGLQIGRLDAPAAQARAHLAEVARAAEEVGLESLWVMDHVVQIPQVGRPWEDVLEAYATLGYLAGVTERIGLGALVTAITFRNLAHVAKLVATLDVLSGGRARCGLGAAWFEQEHRAYGWRFPPLAERYDLLRDACELLPLMWGPGTPAFEGRTTSVPEAICYPRPLQERIPILVGGSGERSTLRLVAEHADACNLFGDPATVARRVAVLRRHCADVGRDPAAVEVTALVHTLTAPDREVLSDRIRARTPRGRAPEATAERLGAGTLEEQIGRMRAYADAGVQVAILAMPVLDAARVAELAPLVDAFR